MGRGLPDVRNETVSHSPHVCVISVQFVFEHTLLSHSSDPDGNGWLLQEITTRLPGRIDLAETAFASANDLASALRRAESAHGEHEKRKGQRDANWADWYAAYMVAEQASEELPQ